MWLSRRETVDHSLEGFTWETKTVHKLQKKFCLHLFDGISFIVIAYRSIIKKKGMKMHPGKNEKKNALCL